jgi:hypothetical protein
MLAGLVQASLIVIVCLIDIVHLITEYFCCGTNQEGRAHYTVSQIIKCSVAIGGA